MAEVYVESKKLDVFEGFKFSFNYSIADIRHPEKRSTTYSKTIQCPGTQNNDEIFGQIYDFNISNGYDGTEPNIDVNFNPNKKAEASVQADGVEVMRGSIQLRKIKRKKSDYIYEVVFVGRLVDIFGVLGEKQLSGFEFDEATQTNIPYIDFSDLDHFYTRTNQETSWTAPYGSGYVYPMLDFGKDTVWFNDSNGNHRLYFVTDFKPALYLKEIIDRIFDFAGFSYTSSFLSSAFFKRLIVPITANTTSNTKRLFRASTIIQGTAPSCGYDLGGQCLIANEAQSGCLPDLSIGNDSRIISLSGNALVCFSNDSTDGNFDNGTYTNFGNYWVNPTVYPNPSGGFSGGWQTLDSGGYSFRVTEDNAGMYNFHVNLSFGYRVSTTGYSEQIFQALVERIEEVYGLTQGDSFSGKVSLMRRTPISGGGWAVSTIAEEEVSIPLSSFGDSGSPTYNLYHGISEVGLIAEGVTCEDGEAIFVAVHFPQSTDGVNATGYSPEIQRYFNSNLVMEYSLHLNVKGSFWNEQTEGADVVDSEFFKFNGNIPEVGMSDLILSVINMFNLYVLPDPDQDKNLLIETRDDFYEGGGVKDWTHKVDHSKELTLEPLALLTANEYEYTYSEDSDYYNERYQDSHGHAYGRARIDINNDFLNNTNTTEVVFSPTPLVNDNPSNRIIGKIYDSDIEEGAQPTDFNVRVLYYGGLIDSDPSWFHISSVEGFEVHWGEYPYAGHLTHPLAPAQDINFGIPNELFYSQNSYTGTLLYTNDNLFNRYHRRGLLEATNKDSKMLTAYLYLEPLDIHKLDFRDQIVIDNSYWRINRIMDYNPFNEGLTKVELIKVITKEPLKFETTPIGGGGGVAGPIRPIRPIRKRGRKNGNYSPLFGGIVKGRDNTVEDGVTSFMVQGNRNRVKTGSTDITISGDDNTVEEGLRGVRLINTSGVTVTESNVTFINNRQQESSEVLDGGLDTVRRIGGGSNIFTVDGGLNIVQTQFSETSIYIVEGN